MNFGQNLRNLRVSRHLTQQKVADDLEISQASITAYECGVREPSFEVVRRFADYFNVAPSVLMPFGEVSNDEYVQRVAESLHQNPKLQQLFDKSKYLSEEDLDTVLAVVSSLSRKYGDNL